MDVAIGGETSVTVDNKPPSAQSDADSAPCNYILVERGLPFLLRDCQGRLPVAWVKYDI